MFRCSCGDEGHRGCCVPQTWEIAVYNIQVLEVHFENDDCPVAIVALLHLPDSLAAVEGTENSLWQRGDYVTL